MSPLPGSPAGPLWREMPISRAILYLYFRAPVKETPPPSGSPDRALELPSPISQSPCTNTTLSKDNWSNLAAGYLPQQKPLPKSLLNTLCR